MIRCAVLDFQCDAENAGDCIVQGQRGLHRDFAGRETNHAGHLERGDERPLCRHTCPHRSVERNQTIMGRRRVGVGVSNIPARLESQQAGVSLTGSLVVESHRTVVGDRHCDQAILEPSSRAPGLSS